MSNEETRLQYAIQEALCWIPGVEAWALTTARRGKLAFGLRELGGNVSGGAYLIGCVDGLLLWCEVKLPGKDVEPGSDQERRLEIARKLGAIAIVAHSVEEAVGFVQRRQRQLQSDREMLHLLCLAAKTDGVAGALRALDKKTDVAAVALGDRALAIEGELLEQQVKAATAKPEQFECPGCKAIHPEQTFNGPCCNPKCGGTWGTGCYHCHHPSFADGFAEVPKP